MITTTLRIDQSLYDKIARIATKQNRSINSQIITIFEEYLEMIKWNNKK